MGLNKVTGAFEQTGEAADNVSAYTEAAVITTVFAGTVIGGSTTSVWLQTAVDNTMERYADLAKLCEYTADPPEIEVHMKYLAGPGEGGTNTPGFARYLKIRVDQDVASDLRFDVRAILKP